MSQSIRAMRGEIDFRRKLSEQQIRGVNYFDDELDDGQLIEVLKERMEVTRNDMMILRSRGVQLSPYLEVGAERCQRSLVMELLGETGVATDLSMAMLRTCNHYATKLSPSMLIPRRVAADIHHLPFPDGSFSIVFCYEFLHHFPSPAEPIEEIYRILRPGGYFWFADEPYKKIIHLNLLKADKLYSKKKLGKNRLMKAIDYYLDYFFAEKTCNETSHGIIENDDITLNQWRTALALFKEKHVILRAPGGREKTLQSPGIINTLLGGNIRGLCKK